MPNPSENTLKKIVESAYIPAIAYAYVDLNAPLDNTSFSFGKINDQGPDVGENRVDATTQFPASSLSKIVFTYLVLEWAKKNSVKLDVNIRDILVKKQIELHQQLSAASTQNNQLKTQAKQLDEVLNYERFMDQGKYPEQAKKITIEHILSHTSGLPNVGADASSTLAFNSEPGEKYNYSGEALLYLQKVLESLTGENLESLAKKYVFNPLNMESSTFLPKPVNPANKLVDVHTEIGKSISIHESIQAFNYRLESMSSLSDLSQAEKAKIYLSENPRSYYVKGMPAPASIPQEIDLTNLASKMNDITFVREILAMTANAGCTPHLNAAGSLLTTSEDFLKFMSAWFERMDEDMFKEAFEPANGQKIPSFDAKDESPVCGLGWHLYRDENNQLIAYQYGENPNTRSFVAMNVTDKKGAAFFTNCEHGMCIGNQLFSSEDFAPIGKTQNLFKSMPRHPQSDEPGWKETLEGKIIEDRAENEVDVGKARSCFVEAAKLLPEDKSKTRRLKWFDKVHSINAEHTKFEKKLESFVGVYTNDHGEKCEIKIKDAALVYEQFGNEIKLVRLTETKFLPEKDQSFKVSLDGKQMIRETLWGDKYELSNQTVEQLQEQTSSYAGVSRALGPRSSHNPQAQQNETPLASSEQKEQGFTEQAQQQQVQQESTEEDEEQQRPRIYP